MTVMEGNRTGSPRERNVIFILFFLILFEFIMLAVCRNQIEVTTASGSDAMTYYNAARNLRKYHILTHDRDSSMYEGLTEAVPTESIAPGYPLFLALLFCVFPESLTTVFASNLVLGIITLLLLWRLMQALRISPWISLAVVFLYANFPTTVDMTTMCLTENLFTPLLLGGCYLCIRASQEKNGFRLAFGAFFCIALASMVRAQAFLFLPVQMILLLSDRHKRRAWRFFLLAGLCSILILYIPMWLWLNRQLGKFILYPTAGDGPRIWGAMPYFIDMSWAQNLTLSQVQDFNSRVAPGEYFRWRSFGMLWRMWFDCWSEDLPHSYYLTHWSLWLHTLVVLPTLILIPVFMRKYTKEATFLAVSPIVLTIACLFYHGLPRYVSAAYPILFALAGYHLQIATKDIRSVRLHRKGLAQPCRPKKKTNWKKGLAIGLWSTFSIVLLYSLCVFSWQVDEEQSAYRLKKYKGVSLEMVRQSELISSATYESENIPVWNTVDLGDGKHWITWQDHAIIQLQGLEDDEEPAPDADIITRVTLDVDGGNLYDFSTVYWLTDDITSWSEDYVYSIPRSSLPLLSANKPELFIDGDVNALLIVPALFRGNEIRINRVIVEKYRVSVPSVHTPSAESAATH